MNKLIIIGNGFDLAHGLKTDYKSFLTWYLTRCFKNASKEREYTDDFLKIVIDPLPNYSNPDVDFRGNFSEFIDSYISGEIIQSGSIILDLNNPWGTLYTLKVSLTSELLERLLGKKGDPNWGDIEHVFYQELKKVLADNKDAFETKRKLTILNNHLDRLKELLREYLLQETQHVNASDQFMALAGKKTELRHILEQKGRGRSQDIRELGDFNVHGKVLFLDFNYTFLIHKKISADSGYIHIPIHGTINGPLDEMIFGYGDEIDEVFHEMEKSNMNEYMRNIKSFGYFKNQHYSDLVRYLSSEPFVVYLWGHSCSLSDRTLLNMIFEHDNCAAIEIFYYENEGYNNYIELTQNISRHFRDKLKMRNRVFNIKNCQSLPQEID
ncbi:AbiH family protein [Sphingobacterium sp. SGR-19]|uniref:AbiH family protein n=1 Tax=Sphingobacterium sp. SGR-19 TaxID=2710886 RepID=UPI0013ED5C5F|nr:AbiH family protein [Sphingobacterium sp. SGR-19]NGM64185.1 hypothetical protein [Sphingobacterium sp. SGR-19]